VRAGGPALVRLMPLEGVGAKGGAVPEWIVPAIVGRVNRFPGTHRSGVHRWGLPPGGGRRAGSGA
jgi:hypothetical protein